MSEFEAVLEQLGAFGPYQVRVFLLVSAFETPAAWAMLLPVFAHAKPSWICPALEVNNTQGPDPSNVTVRYDQCMPSGDICQGANFTSGFTSIITEVIIHH